MIYLCTCPLPRKEPSAHYYRTSATFFSPIQLQSTPGAPFPLTSPIPPVRRWLVVHHPLISLHTPLIDQSSRPATLSNQPLFQLPAPRHPFSVLSDRHASAIRRELPGFGSWNPLGQLVVASLKVLLPAQARRLTDSGWNLHLYNPPTTHSLAPAIQISVAYPASRTYILILLPAHQAYSALPRPAKSIIGLFLFCRVDRTLPTFYFGPGIRRSEKFAPSGNSRDAGTSHRGHGQKNLVKAPSWSSGSRSIKSKGLLHGSNHTPSGVIYW